MAATQDKAILTCALTGVLTDPSQYPVPVTPAQMAAEARDAFNAGASIMHVHLRRQEPGMGHLPSWDPEVAAEIEAESTRQGLPVLGRIRYDESVTAAQVKQLSVVENGDSPAATDIRALWSQVQNAMRGASEG